jgi:dTDP-glucose pyrophosphorylase
MELPKKLKDRIIRPDQSILNALKKMDELVVKSLVVSTNGTTLDGILSIGDIQRAIMNGINLDEKIQMILRANPSVLSPNHSNEEARVLVLKNHMEFLPVINPDTKEILKVYFWSDFFPELEIGPAKQFNLPVVIMAGGLGNRLKPLTNVIPKPLIPLGDKTIIEQIFDRFSLHGCNSFYISVNYKAELIEYYLKEKNLKFKLEYFKESKPMGTAGSLSLLKGKINQTFFVSNCDIIIEQDYSEILDYHRANNNELTIVAALKHYPIPYGIVESGENGSLESLTEKPELTFKINSGMYVLEPQLLEEIQNNEFYHITSLIEKIVQRNGKVGVFPVSEKSWKDIGDWNEYLDTILIRKTKN